MISVAVIFDNLGPYHVARLRAASSVCQLTAIEVAGASATYAWRDVASRDDFRRVTLLEGKTSSDVSRSELYSRLRGALDEVGPDVVFVPGWGSPVAWGSLLACLDQRAPIVLMSDSTEWDEPRSAWKECVKSKLVALGSSALVAGARSRNYIAKLGMPAERVFVGYDVVDNDYFSSAAAGVRSGADEVRRERGLPENYFLASARFVEKKNLRRLLEAYALYRQTCGERPWSLVLLGDGPLRTALESQVGALGLGGHVQMPGFRQYADLPAWYALAGAFVHASVEEPWGLVVNEAAASGLPLIVSNRCGCVPELVLEDVNGFTFDPLDVQALAEKLRCVSAAGFPRAIFGAESGAIVAEWGLDRFAAGLSQAVESALSRPAIPPPPINRAILSLIAKR